MDGKWHRLLRIIQRLEVFLSEYLIYLIWRKSVEWFSKFILICRLDIFQLLWFFHNYTVCQSRASWKITSHTHSPIKLAFTLVLCWLFNYWKLLHWSLNFFCYWTTSRALHELFIIRRFLLSSCSKLVFIPYRGTMMKEFIRVYLRCLMLLINLVVRIKWWRSHSLWVLLNVF